MPKPTTALTLHEFIDANPIPPLAPDCDGTIDCQLLAPCDECTALTSCADCQDHRDLHTSRIMLLLDRIRAAFEHAPDAGRHAEKEWEHSITQHDLPAPSGVGYFIDEDGSPI